MSASSTPASSQPSRDGSALDVLTPVRKVLALLAQFDDSDSDASIGPKHRRKALNASSERPQSTSHTRVPHSPRSATSATAGDEDEEDLPVARRGRLAGRLDSPESEEQALPRSASADSRSKARAIPHGAPGRQGSQLRMPIESSEEELSRTAPTRRLLLKSKRDPPSATVSSTHLPREASPTLPTAAPAGTASPISVNAHVELDADNPPPGPSADGKSKFLALVEKHRKQRLAKEAAEIAKRAARVDQLSKVSKNSRRQQGSSVADSSGDDTLPSDEEAGSRLEKEARPTRKASKKALEEMN